MVRSWVRGGSHVAERRRSVTLEGRIMDAHWDLQLFQNITVQLLEGNRLVLDPFQLSSLQYTTLLLLDMDEGWRLTDLSERLLCERSTVTRIIDALETRQLVRRVPDPEDRRSQRVTITDAGATMREQAHAALEASLIQRFGCLNEDERHQLRRLHEKLTNGLKVEGEKTAETF
ncbi:MarR family transcriptional regulator [Dictyobacter alpinus]|uniref:MarR family transcriptional regulator n=1 Tax=Dictyobacter alpinus TaxID=2014873 RepID=A0A402BE97_9CHLR|nr:MarR family transcriptional regulator [Dictyobacter alpinus]GCE29704.1 MarR family transcriptional regulator [Dictyobacter alpinus]